MPYEVFLAFRYLRSRRRRRLARVTAGLAIIGIAFGVAALIVALALGNGFHDELRDKILSGTAHLTVTRADGQAMPDYHEICERIRRVVGVTSASPTTYDGAVLTGPTGSSYAVLRGIDSESIPVRLELQRTLMQGSATTLFETSVDEHNEPRLPNVVLGSELAKRTGLQLNDVAEIIPASASLVRHAPVYRHVRVAGIFRSGLFEYDSTWIYLSFDRAAIFAGAERAASLISVEVVGMLVISLVILIAALNITTTLVLVVVERRSDIAILRTMRAKPGSILLVFMIEGAVIGAVGSIIGVLLGQLACVVGNHYKLVRIPADVYSIATVPLNSHLRDALLAAVVAFLLSLLATIYPAQAAARVRPVDALRENH